MNSYRRDESWLQSNGLYKCPLCGKEYPKAGITSHMFRTHTERGKLHNPFISLKDKPIWNKGLTKETDERLKRTSETHKANLKAGKIIPSQLGKPISPEHKQKISKAMKLAHKEGRAWNIGMSRWNNKPSYPETFFMRAISNEFEDKNYVREFNVGIYAIDFAWISKKLAIEIDGQQHHRFEDYKQRDIRKDKCLTENGWTILRIAWIDMYNEPNKWIKVAKDFIHG